MSDPAPLRVLADELRALAAEPRAVGALRQSIVDLQADDRPAARQAGQLWGAALGALAELRDARTDAGAAQYLQLAVDLFAGGLDAWLGLAGEDARAAVGGDPVERSLLTELAAVCGAGRRALRGEGGAAEELERRIQATRRSVRALSTRRAP